jgi:hypothetical protein
MLPSIISDARAQSLGERTSQLGVTMFRRASRSMALLLAAASTAILVSGCGGSAATPTAPATGGPAATASPASESPGSSGTAAASGSPEESLSPSPTENLGLQHVDAALEDKLPNIIGNVQLEKMSMPLSTYIHSSQGNDKILYTPWLVPFGKTPDDINIAIAVDLTQTENFFEQAIQVPGASAASLANGFAQVARDKKWPVDIRSVAAKSVLEITDPKVDAAGGLGTAYVYASGDVLYVIVTDDPSLLVEALIKLP